MSARPDLIPLVEALGAARVLCVGDVMLDRFVTGTVERISPEAPIPVLRIGRETAMLGGAGNVVCNLVALGGAVRFVAVIGEDGEGREIRTLIEDLETVAPALVEEAGRTTTIKTRFLAANQQILRTDRETTNPLPKDIRKKIQKTAIKGLRHVNVVVLSDYGKGMLDETLCQALIGAAKKARSPVIVDPKGGNYARYRGAALITPNLKELAAASHMEIKTDDAVIAACRALIKAHDLGAILATRSQDGMTLVTAGDDIVQLKAETREVFDVSGAGDTVVATLAAALSVGAKLEDAAALANVAAGIVVGKVGTAAAYAADVVGALHHRDISDAEAKVLGLDQALDRIGLWRRKGLTVGFTNGCFDLLHPGHISLLSQAKKACDRLVVGLNSDSSVKRLGKGDGRPVQSEAARAAVLASLAPVDMVVIFADDTPIGLIEAFHPDVLVKGADYKLDQVVGAGIVKKAGGTVLLAKLEPGHSTTATIKRLKKKH